MRPKIRRRLKPTYLMKWTVVTSSMMLFSRPVRSQVGWSEEVSQNWFNKRAKLLAKVLAKCAGPDIDSYLQDLTCTTSKTTSRRCA